jgi:hypothetical protein
MKVKLNKVNSGIMSTIIGGRIKKREVLEEVHYAAKEWFEEEVIGQNQLQKDFFQWKRGDGKPYLSQDGMEMSFGYEPWGFAIGGRMADTGSCPTESRARTLELYQSVFEEKWKDGKICGFEVILNVESYVGSFGIKRFKVGREVKAMSVRG